MIALRGLPMPPGEGHSAGRKLLEEMVAAHTGAPMPPIAVTDRGKPYFTEGSLHFSISHSKHHVFCALSDTPIGIDAEEADREISLSLAKKILSPPEYTQWQQAFDPRKALLTFWVLKEAQAKATGQGLRGYPNSTNFSLDDPRVTEIDGCLVAVLKGE